MNIFIYYLYGAINVLGTLQSNKRQQPCHQDLATWEMRAGLLHLNDQGWIAGGEDETYRIKKKYSSPPSPPFHCLWLVTVTFEVIWIHIYSINIWQVVSSQAFLLHLVERSPASRRPLVFKVKLPLGLDGPAGLLVQVYLLRYPRTHKGVIRLSFLCCHLLADGRQLSAEG